MTRGPLTAFGAAVNGTEALKSANDAKSDAKSGASSVSAEPSQTIPQYYESYAAGPGIWKWSNALEAYERHFAAWKGTAVRIGEVGVWSGGSLRMWHDVFGPRSSVYGMDIDEQALQFHDPPGITISLLDQGKADDWSRFFNTVTPYLDILVDDGGHLPPLMLQTTWSAWWHLPPGGVMSIEDVVCGLNFTRPAAEYYAGPMRASLGSLHMYPLVLISQKASPTKAPFDPSLVPGAMITPVQDLSAMTAALQAATPGSLVVLQNPALGDFLGSSILHWAMEYFNGLHSSQGSFDNPPGCHVTNAAICSLTLVNSHQQNTIVGVHILSDKLVVETARTPPVLHATRHGTTFVKWPY